MTTTALDALLSPRQRTKNLPPEQVLLTRKEAAEWLGVKPNTLAVWVSSKRYSLPVVKVGRLAKYRLSDLQAFIVQNEQ